MNKLYSMTKSEMKSEYLVFLQLKLSMRIFSKNNRSEEKREIMISLYRNRKNIEYLKRIYGR